MTARSHSTGFALLLVLWTLVMLSTIAFTLAASVQTEVRASQDSWNVLQAERLAKSGQEIAMYLESSRSIATSGEDLSGLPVEPIVPWMQYRVTLKTGEVNLYLEGENGKFDLAAAGEGGAAAFLNSWTREGIRSQKIAASIADWMDPDDEPRPSGAEFYAYAKRGYRPRNGELGLADLPLIDGLDRVELGPTIDESAGAPSVRVSLSEVIALVPAGRSINPNYAPPEVLHSLSGMNAGLVSRILDMRTKEIFANAQDFRQRLGLPLDSPLLTQVIFDRGAAPAIRSVAHVDKVVRVERSVRRRTFFGNTVILTQRHLSTS
jgi:type II secretory pathway component PulK